MELCDLPPEILRTILVQAVISRGLKRGLRLRLVSRLFGGEAINALYESGLLEIALEKCYAKYGKGFWFNQFWRGYITYKVMTNKFSHCSRNIAARFTIIRRTAEILCALTNDPEQKKLREYIGAQCFQPAVILADLDPESFESETARYLLQGAILNKLPDTVRKILSSADTPRDVMTNWTIQKLISTPLRLAGIAGNLEVLEILLSSPLHSEGMGRMHALYGAIYGGNLDAVQFIADGRWGPIHFFSATQPLDSHIISGMVRSQHTDFQDRLYSILRSRASESQCTTMPEDPLVNNLLDEIVSRQEQRVDVVEQLLHKGAKVQVKQTPGTPIPLCRYRNNYSGFPMSWNPLRQAVNSNNEKIVRLLLDRGADPNTADGDILWLAVKRGCMDIVRMLVESGVDVNKVPTIPLSFRKDRVRPPIEHALKLEHKEMCKYLLDNGTVIDAGLDGIDRRKLVRRIKEEGLESMVHFLEDHGIVDPSPYDVLPPEEKEREESPEWWDWY